MKFPMECFTDAQTVYDKLKESYYCNMSVLDFSSPLGRIRIEVDAGLVSGDIYSSVVINLINRHGFDDEDF